MIRLALFISGGGTTAEAILRNCKKNKVPIRPSLVVSSSDKAAGIKKIISTGFSKKDIVTINPKKFSGPRLFGDALIAECKKHDIDIIGQYGWLPLTPKALIDCFPGKIINQHPGPLDPPRPDFGGQGMYGRRVHAAILYFRRITKHNYWTEATAHFVTEEFDKGEVIVSRQVDILPGDTVEELQKRVLPVEHEVQIRALISLAKGKVKTVKRKNPLIRKHELSKLDEAKRIAKVYYPFG